MKPVHASERPSTLQHMFTCMHLCVFVSSMEYFHVSAGRMTVLRCLCWCWTVGAHHFARSASPHRWPLAILEHTACAVQHCSGEDAQA